MPSRTSRERSFLIRSARRAPRSCREPALGSGSPKKRRAWSMNGSAEVTRSLRALAVERPVEHPRGPAPAVGRHAVQPAGDQRRLADASEGDEGEDVGGRVFPGGVETGELGLAADEVRAGDGQAAEVEVGADRGRRARGRRVRRRAGKGGRLRRLGTVVRDGGEHGRLGRVGRQAHQIGIDQRLEQAGGGARRDPQRDQFAVLAAGILHEGSGPLRLGVVGLEIVVGQDDHGLARLAGRLLHLQDEVAAGPEVPRLVDHLIAGLFERPGDPVGPGPVGAEAARTRDLADRAGLPGLVLMAVADEDRRAAHGVFRVTRRL